MNKRELQNFAVWAKENLENQIKVSLNLMGIHSDDNIKRAYVQGDITIIEGESKTFPKEFNASRNSIVNIVKEEGYENVIEQFAYTWFNRIVALRFMEVHGYLDHGFKIFPDDGIIEPEILSNLHFINDELNLDVEYYTKLKEEDNIEELYRYILFKQCNSLSKILPMLFSNEYNYLEYLLPTVLLTGETIITKIVELDKENFLNDVEVIGWLYQFYVSHLREDVRKNKKTAQEDIPILSQIFTPDWIVKYMAENSIGRIWLESYPSSNLKNKMKYYVDEAEQIEEVERELEQIRYKNVNPEDIKIIEPAAGSGHILVYAFDLLLKMYEEKGFLTRDIPSLILKNNLVGLDIDKRASQLGQFALMMKARSLDPRFFNDDRRIIPKVFEIKDSKKLFNLEYKENLKELIENDWKNSEYNLTENDLKLIDYVVRTFDDSKIIGSLLNVKPSKGYLLVGDKINKLRRTTVGGVFTNEFVLYGLKRLSELLRLAHFMSIKYDVMITNPPYLSISGFETSIKKYFTSNYPNSKSDMFAMFMEVNLVKENGFRTLVNPDSWMFLKSYEKLREKLLEDNLIINMTHHGMGEFDAVVQTTSFVIRNNKLAKYKSSFFRLVKVKEKEDFFLNSRNNNLYITSGQKFLKIPGVVIGYFVDKSLIEIFDNSVPLDNISEPRQGMIPGNTKEFLRFWYEVNINKIGLNNIDFLDINKYRKKWFPYNKGGPFRRWYGNIEHIINMENDGYDIKFSGKNNNYRLRDPKYYFKEGVTWSKINSGNFSTRYQPPGNLFDIAGCVIFELGDNLKYILGLTNSKIISEILKFISPTLNYEVDHIKKIPVIIKNKVEVEELVDKSISLASLDWNEKETSADFSRHFYIMNTSDTRIEYLYKTYKLSKENNINSLFNIEKALNLKFSQIYNYNAINNDPNMIDIKKTIGLQSKKEASISFISYLIGILMGRYSLVEEGLIYAGGEFDNTRYGNYEVVSDGIIPIYSKLGMEDGLTAKIITLIKQIYGKDTYKENIDFIAEGLGKKQNETSEETLNRYLNDEFYKDHLKTYQKRPIYWMFSSGKDNGFKVLIYLHRYTEDTLAIINSNYLLPETTRLRVELNDIENGIKTSDDITRRRLEKERDIVSKQYYEAVEYGLFLDHMANRYIKLDLDDGVLVNYAKFQGVEIINDRGTKIKKDLLVPYR